MAQINSDLITPLKGLMNAVTIFLICWGVSKVLPSINRILDTRRKVNSPDVHIHYTDCIIEKEKDVGSKYRL